MKLAGSARMGFLALAVVVLLASLPPVTAAPAAAAMPRPANVTYPPLQATLTGPSLLSPGGKGTFVIAASGGPAMLFNGTIVGNYTFNTTLLGPDTQGYFVSPPSGAFLTDNQSFTVGAPVINETFVFEVTLTSHGNDGNVTDNYTATFQVVQPYVVAATVENPSGNSVSGSVIDIALDGTFVGTLDVPSLSAGGSAAVQYNYTTLGLAPGWHTFTLTLVSDASLLVFSGGGRTMSVSFYVPAPAPNLTIYYVGALGLVLLAIFISLLLVGPRRSRRKKASP